MTTRTESLIRSQRRADRQERWQSTHLLPLVVVLFYLATFACLLQTTNQLPVKGSNENTLYQLLNTPYGLMYDTARSLPCPQPAFQTAAEILQGNTDLLEAYENSLQQWLRFYQIDPGSIVAQAIDDALFREMFESGDRFGCLFDGLTVSNFKAKFDDSILDGNPVASVGLMDLQPIRVTAAVMAKLPADVRAALTFDLELGYVVPETLVRYLNTDSLAERMDRSIVFAVATAAAYQTEALGLAQKNGLNETETRMALSVLICCSDHDSATTQANYGWRLLAFREDLKKYLADDGQNLNQYDHRGHQQLGELNQLQTRTTTHRRNVKRPSACPIRPDNSSRVTSSRICATGRFN